MDGVVKRVGEEFFVVQVGLDEYVIKEDEPGWQELLGRGVDTRVRVSAERGLITKLEVLS